MTREEWRAGLIRLALLAASVVATIAATAVILHLVGATTSRAIAAGCAIVAIPFLLGGVVVHMRGEVTSRRSLRRLDDDPLARTQRRDADRLALGLLAAGVALFAAAVTIG